MRGIGRLIEHQFEFDLSCLQREGRITSYYKSKWHGHLDYQGIDALVTRIDGKEIKIDVTTNRGVKRAILANKEMSKKGLDRRNIMVWGHDVNSPNPKLRREKLLEAINEFVNE